MKSKDIGITVFICPRCQQRCSRMPMSGDFEHSCYGSEVLANEDVVVIGNWTDFSGSDNNVPANVMSTQGQVNTLQGTRADLEGHTNYPRTSRGFNKGTHRTRPHIHSIPDEAFSKKGIRTTEPVTSHKV